MEDQGEGIAHMVREDDELQARISAEAKVTAHGLVQSGPDQGSQQSF